jgi:hypothetical protein
MIAGGLALVMCAVAVAASIADADGIRRWLAYPFAGIPARPAEAIAIFLHNLRALAAIGGLLLVAQSSYRASPTGPGPVHRAVQLAGEVMLGSAVAANVLLVGASLGAYGARMARAVLPHGPVELVAYALALALYLQGRNRAIALSHTLAIVALSAVTLALAAGLETYVSL